ncbi:hypothetical protein ATANTOWER_010189 [Ataeniobius toweri]|uniref:Uncharacterized protein n=1 Tax=Ataeniobius toweri TaxID=208326 RepID=A0ABU7ATE3_9TELE|nr:hypothetical protein [Ataeniobius toweri]
MWGRMHTQFLLCLSHLRRENLKAALPSAAMGRIQLLPEYSNSAVPAAAAAAGRTWDGAQQAGNTNQNLIMTVKRICCLNFGTREFILNLADFTITTTTRERGTRSL